MAFPGQVTATKFLGKREITRKIVLHGGLTCEETTWEIKTEVTTFDGYAIVNGVMCAKHNHRIDTTIETTLRPVVAPVVHHHGHHGGASPFPGLKVTPHPMAIFPAPGAVPVGGHVIDPAVWAGVRPPHIAMFDTFTRR
jgi:hypothetical protein